ncbi:hypothetical protein MFRU_039g00730 [Monilinia fructicola]|nr:hypothetical protein MFRU_039g00730 [Monilinia fructicola]
MLKKSGILLSSCSHLQCYYASSYTSTTSLRSPHAFTFASPHPPSHHRHQCRKYAIVSDGRSANQHAELQWPELTSAYAVPTPYQIFNQRKGSPYSKQRFYELVKLYHPDKHGIDTHDGLDYDTKLSRYRLIVAANDILSNPVKRNAYDTYGAGWNGRPDVLDPRDRQGDSHGWAGPGGPSQNATWEDWEKWYKRDVKGKQEPKFVSNGAFVLLIAVFVVVGGIGQFTRVDNYSIKFLEQTDTLHDRMSKDLRQRRKDTRYMFGSREERIHSFLRQREDPREETFRKLLPNPEVCSSEDVKGRSMAVYHPEKKTPKD